MRACRPRREVETMEDLPVVNPSGLPLSRRRNLVDLAFGVVLGVSLCLNVILLFSDFRTGSTPPSQAPRADATIGAQMSPLVLTREDGSESRLSYVGTDRPTVLYVLSPACAWCKRNTGNIRHLAKQSSDRFRFVGVTLSREGLEQYLVESHPGFDIAGQVRQEDLDGYGFSGTPFTAVIGNDGKLIKSWRGAYSSRAAGEIEDFFGIKLVGLGMD